MSYVVPRGAPSPHGAITPGDWRYGNAPGQVPWRAPAPPAIQRPSSPLTYQHVKVSIAEIPRVLGEMQEKVNTAKRNHVLLYCALLIPLIACAVLIWPMALFAFFVAAVFFFLGRSKVQRTQRKVDFLRDLLAELVDELHPRSPVRIDFDPVAYHARHKILRSGRSAAGGEKKWYSDKWLRLRLVLADRTEVEIVRQAGIKTKKGVVQTEKRRLFVTVTPYARRYQPMLGEPMAHRLRHQIQHAIAAGFHDPPEQLSVHVAHHTQDIAIRVAQHDADILPREVTVVLHAVMTHLWERCLVRPQR